MIPTLILFYILGIFQTFIYLVETLQVSNSDQRMIMFCCSLVYPVYVLYLIQNRVSYFTFTTFKEAEEIESEGDKVDTIHFGFMDADFLDYYTYDKA